MINTIYNNMYSFSNNRITGLFSGIDTDSLVKNMAQAEQSKIDKTYKAMTKLQWKKEAYTGVNSKIQTFQDKYLSQLSSENLWSKKSFTLSDTNTVDDIINKVKGFVSEYNNLVSSLNSIVKEQRNYKYDVLTESQRKELDKEDLAEYDSYAKSGILRNDYNISNLLTNMRTSLYEKVGQTGLSPADIGIKTGLWDKFGQINLDENKLRAAIENDSEAVAKVFAGASNEDGNGLLTKLSKQFTDFKNTISSNIIKKLDTDVSNYDKKMEEQLDALYTKQEQFYKQFASLEKLMSQYNSQMSYFSSMFQ